MTTINHSEVAIGRRHCVHNLQYADAANRYAGTNEANGIVLSADNVGQIAYQIDSKSYWILTDHSPITWEHIITGVPVDNGLRVTTEAGGFYVEQENPISLADDGYIDLPAFSCGFGRFLLSTLTGGTIEYADLMWSRTGTPEFVSNSVNTVLADTDTKFAIFDNGGGIVRVKNRLGAVKALVFEFFYTPIITR